MKLCLIGSAGGHLTQLLQLNNLWEKYDFFFVTEYRKITNDLNKKYKIFYVQDINRKPLNFIKNFIQSWKIFSKEKPDVIITTGGGVAVPLSLIAKLFGKKLICIESVSRIESASITSKVLYPFSDLFLVQWKSALKFHGKKAKYGGRVF